MTHDEGGAAPPGPEAQSPPPAQTAAPDQAPKPTLGRLLAQLPTMPLFQGVPLTDLPDLAADLEWFSVPGGWRVIRQGDPSESLYLVLTGSLGLVEPGTGNPPVIAGQFGAGQTVGEVGLLSGEARTASIVAVRDTELLRITTPVFRKLIAKCPLIMENLGRLVVLRLKQMIEGRPDPAIVTPPKTIALVPVTTRVPCRAFGEALVAGLNALGRRAILLDRSREQVGTDWLHALEADYDHILYLSDGEPARWTKLCLRQADKVVLLARHDGLSPHSLPLESTLLAGPLRPMDLVLLHPAGQARPAAAAGPWIERFRPRLHHHVCLGDDAAIRRLARHCAGRAVGLVLAGGGARGFAHIGVLKALREAGIPIDMLAGTSIGGIMAAGIASGWSLEEVEERAYRSFVVSNPLNDITFPLTAFVRGKKVTRLLRENFGTTQIEDLWLPFFCVSSNLTQGRQNVHRSGVVWQALRASIAIPGILPPVVRRGEILVDGAVMNNFPVSLMGELGRGPVIGVDVEDHEAFTTVPGQSWREADWGILGDTVLGGPGIVSLLMRAGTVNSERQTHVARARTDLLFDPPLDGIGVPDWRLYKRAVDIGYAHACEVLAKADLSAFPRQ